MQAYLEVEFSELFQKHFFGPANIGLIPDGKTPTAMMISLVGIEVAAHTATAGSVYQGAATVNGETGYIFYLNDGIDTHECLVFQRDIGAIVTITG